MFGMRAFQRPDLKSDTNSLLLVALCKVYLLKGVVLMLKGVVDSNYALNQSKIRSKKSKNFSQIKISGPQIVSFWSIFEVHERPHAHFHLLRFHSISREPLFCLIISIFGT